jgi:hypothetical protein
MIAALIKLLLSNFIATFLVIGLIFSAAAILRAKKPVSAALIAEKLLSWHIFFVIGCGYFLNFIYHSFFGEMAAKFIGWADSPFQFEVGTASLGFAAVGFYAAFNRFEARVAAVLGHSLFMLGAAVGHVHQMITGHNFAPGNAGLFFYADIVIPLLGFFLLWLRKRHPGPV